MTSAAGEWGGYGQDGDSSREPGTRRRKIAGYLKAANELRQTYQQGYLQSRMAGPDGSGNRGSLPEAFPDLIKATAKAGEQEMLLFPSYARRHVKAEPSAVPGTIQEAPGSGRDVRDSTGAGDAEYWKQQWEKYEHDKAVVDVDVRGWIYSPHRGPLGRKGRLFVGLARQLAGIPAPSESPSSSKPGSRASSPHRVQEKMEAHNAKHEKEIVAKEAETLMRKGEAEADAANKGAYSEEPSGNADGSSQRRDGSTEPYDDVRIQPLRKPASWTAPEHMSPAELATANSHLMARLKPFLVNPLATIPISAFFYNQSQSRQKTVDTDASGHFGFQVALDFVPTHVRILAAEGLSATEEVVITEPTGVSVISDIDDTIKHSDIVGGAREIFRNVFIRELGDLCIQGVRTWYQRLADMGVTFHYVSNSPWQLYPVIKAFFAMAGLPKGSFHLKQYAGMFQGIFEPVAERKKGTLEKLLRDFPERRFILVGDSGEADLEVYTDVVCENPGRILGVFIRDITSPPGKKGFFDSSMESTDRRQSGIPKTYSTDSILSTDRKPPQLPPRRSTEPRLEEENLIDLASDSEDQPPGQKAVHLSRAASQIGLPEPEDGSSHAVPQSLHKPIEKKQPPAVPPKKPSMVAAAAKTSGLDTGNSPSGKPRPPPPPQQLSYRAAAKQRLSAAYEHLPSAPSYFSTPSSHESPQNTRQDSCDPTATGIPIPRETSKLAENSVPPPLPARKPVPPTQSYASTAASYASSLYASATSRMYTDQPPHAFKSSSSTSTQLQNPAYAYSSNSTNAAQSDSRKVELWKRRLARSRAILADDNVLLMTWRVGEDAESDAAALVEAALAEMTRREARSKTNSGRHRE